MGAVSGAERPPATRNQSAGGPGRMLRLRDGVAVAVDSGDALLLNPIRRRTEYASEGRVGTVTNYAESMFEDQDDLVERAVAWLCQASEDAGEDAGQWARTLALVEGRLDTLREAACGEVRRTWILEYRETHGVWPFAGPSAYVSGSSDDPGGFWS